MTQEERCLNHLIYSDIPYNREKLPLSMFVSYLAGRESVPTLIKSDVERYLANKGVIVDWQNVYLSRNEKALPASAFKDTEWEGQGWKDALLRINGVSSEKAKRFCSGLVSSAIVVPLDMILKS